MNIIIYHTGTGNSLWCAKTITDKLEGRTKIIPASFIKENEFEYYMRDYKETNESEIKSIGFIFPVLMWGVPPIVKSAIEKIQFNEDVFCYGIANKGGQLGSTLIQLKKILQNHKLTLASGFQIKMPFNCISMGGPGSPQSIQNKITHAENELSKISRIINSRKPGKIKRGVFLSTGIFNLLNKMAQLHIHEMDKDFHTDEKCNSCGKCKNTCLNNNIEMRKGLPVWLHKCTMCLACLQWCPKEAIQYGKHSEKRSRYHHPEIKWKQIADPEIK